MKKLMTVIGLVLVICLLAPISCDKAPKSDLSFMTEMERQEWEERGFANVDSVEFASILVGFPVVVPSYIPEGFQRSSKFMVRDYNAGRPEILGEPKFDWIEVQQVFSWQGEEDSDMFLLIQSTHKFDIGGGESFEICGKPGERHFSEADSRLTFGWEDDGIYYAITALMLDHLDEEILEKIACSIGTE